MIPTPTKTFTLRCPRCSSQEIRKNLLVEAMHLVAVDPLTGEVRQGIMADRLETGVPPTYYCRSCHYENVVPTMFVTEE